MSWTVNLTPILAMGLGCMRREVCSLLQAAKTKKLPVCITENFTPSQFVEQILKIILMYHEGVPVELTLSYGDMRAWWPYRESTVINLAAGTLEGIEQEHSNSPSWILLPEF